MKFIRQFLIIILISFAGELLHAILPLPVPASIYGLLILLAGSCSDHGYNCSDNSAGYGREWKNRSVCTEERGEEG